MPQDKKEQLLKNKATKMSEPPVDLGTRVRNAARLLIYPLYTEAQGDAEGWGKQSYLHSGKINAYSEAISQLESGKDLESVREMMRGRRTEADGNIVRGSDMFSWWTDSTFDRNYYNEKYVEAADNVIKILDDILGKK